jgi:hypothetical protein
MPRAISMALGYALRRTGARSRRAGHRPLHAAAARRLDFTRGAS